MADRALEPEAVALLERVALELVEPDLERAREHVNKLFALVRGGNVFLDFAGGIGVMNVGHADRGVLEAVRKQAGQFTHTELDEGLEVMTSCLVEVASAATMR